MYGAGGPLTIPQRQGSSSLKNTTGEGCCWMGGHSLSPMIFSQFISLPYMSCHVLYMPCTSGVLGNFASGASIATQA